VSENIRIGYSGFITFISRILSLFSGLIFIILVTHHLSQYDFGLWQLILSIITYSVLPNVIVDYWAIRDLARGERNATTAVLFSLLLSAGGMAMYLIISLLSSSKVGGGEFSLFMIALAQVPLSYLSITLQTISQAARPQSVGIAFVIFEVVKVVIAAFAFFQFGITLNVAITAVLFALVAQCTVLIIMQPRRLYSRSFNKQIVKKWLKVAWLPAFITFAGYLATFDSLIVTMVTGSTLVLANFRAANVIAGLVAYAGAFTFALYPKLIGGGAVLHESRYVTKLIMLFSIPMATGVFILAVPLLSVFGNNYSNAYMLVWLGIPFMVIGSIHQVFESILMAREKVDVAKSSFKNYRKSRLFTIPEIALFGNITGLSILSIVSYWLTLNHASPITIAVAWSILGLPISFIGLIIKWKMMQKSNATFEFPWKNIAIYAGASIAMALVLIASGAHDFSHNSTIDLVVKILAYGALAIAIYTPIVFALDKEFRRMAYKSIEVIKMIMRKPRFNSNTVKDV
jgi:O-antigen/teichoic acid export membrane protein